MKHIHAEAIHAWAEGYDIEKKTRICCEKEGYWTLCKVPLWYPDEEYRIKPREEEHEYLPDGRD